MVLASAWAEEAEQGGRRSGVESGAYVLRTHPRTSVLAVRYAGCGVRAGSWVDHCWSQLRRRGTDGRCAVRAGWYAFGLALQLPDISP